MYKIAKDPDDPLPWHNPLFSIVYDCIVVDKESGYTKSKELNGPMRLVRKNNLVNDISHAFNTLLEEAQMEERFCGIWYIGIH